MFDKPEEYRLNKDLHNYIVEVFEERSEVIFNIFNHFSSINAVYSLGLRYKLNALEDKLFDVLSTVEDTTDVKLYFEEYLRKLTVDFFKLLGVNIDYDRELLTLENIEEFLDSVITILYLDANTSAELLSELELDDIPGDEKLVSILTGYSTIQDDVLFKMILSVSDEFFNTLIIHFKAKIHRGIEDVNPEDLKKIEPLIVYSRDFGFCKFIKNGLYYGFVNFKFEDSLDNLYRVLDSYHGDVKNIAYEIFAVNFLSKDKPIKKGEDIEEYVNIKPMIENNYLATIDEIIKIYDMLYKDIMESDK